MAPMRHFWILAAIVFIAAWAAPSSAMAHDGHGNRAPAVVETSVIATPTSSPEASKDTQLEMSFMASQILVGVGSSAAGCIGGCCGNMVGMACCGGAIIPGVIEAPPVQLSKLFDFDHMLPVHGLPPEAFPKPPKAFA